MTDELNAATREMLDQAIADEQSLLPDAGRRRQLKRALLQAAVVSSAGSATLAKAATLEGARLLSAGAASAPWLALGKSVLVGLLASGGLLGGVQLISAPSEPANQREPKRRVTGSTPSAAAVPEARTAAPTPSTTEPSEPEAESAPTLAPASPAGKASALAPPGSSDPALRAELELMTAAQAALRDGKPARALELLQRYDAAFPTGQLGRERLAAEVFGACQLGDRARAARAAARFLLHDTDSALAQRVKQACPLGSSQAP
jgi:hypothetical protein